MVTKEFDKFLATLSRDWQHSIATKLTALAASPFVKHTNVAKLRGRLGRALQIGRWRIFYDVDEGQRVLMVLDARRILKMYVENVFHNGEDHVLVATRDFEKLMRNAQMRADVRAYDAAKDAIADTEHDAGYEMVPFTLAQQRREGENPVKLWREYRGLTPEQLAAVADVPMQLLAEIENGKKICSDATRNKLASALECAPVSLVGCA